jgi:hypothetical protein
MPVILRSKENQYRAFMYWDAGHDNIIGSDRISLPTPGLSLALPCDYVRVARYLGTDLEAAGRSEMRCLQMLTGVGLKCRVSPSERGETCSP